MTLTFDLWPWPFVCAPLWSFVITPDNFITIRWLRNNSKVWPTDRTDRRIKLNINRGAWSQLKTSEWLLRPRMQITWGTSGVAIPTTASPWPNISTDFYEFLNNDYIVRIPAILCLMTSLHSPWIKIARESFQVRDNVTSATGIRIQHIVKSAADNSAMARGQLHKTMGYRYANYMGPYTVSNLVEYWMNRWICAHKYTITAIHYIQWLFGG